MTARWPQHHLAACIAVALVVAPRWPALLPVLAAVAWATQPRTGWATAAVAAVLLAAAVGVWRQADAERTARAPLARGVAVGPSERVEVLETADRSLSGGWRTTVRLRGATVELRTPVAASAPDLVPGRLIRVRGRLRPVGEGAVGARSRGIALTLDAQIVGTAGRRGGWRGAIDRFRERAERALTAPGAGNAPGAGYAPGDDNAPGAGNAPGDDDAPGAGNAPGDDDGPTAAVPSTGDRGGGPAPGPAEEGSGAGVVPRTAADTRTALLRGMVLGQDDGFTDDEEERFRRSGLSHLVAASGQNVALVAALAIGIAALCGLSRPARIGWALLAVALYVPLAGGGPSIRRAGVTGVLTLLALGLGRAPDRWWALLLAAIATVVVDPFSPEQLGWQLSFAAVVGLLVLAPPLTAAARRAGWPPWLGAAAAVPLGAGLATAPVLAAGVGDVSLTSLPANLVVEPVVAPVTWLGMLAGLLGPEGAPVTGWLVRLAGPFLDWTGGVATWAASPDWAVVRPGPGAALVPVLGLLAALVVVQRPAWLVRGQDLARRRAARTGPGRRALRLSRLRPVRIGAVALVAVGLVLATVLGARRSPGGHPVLDGDGVVVLDVGQGSATLLRQGDATILVDAGPVDGRVLDRLAEQGVTRLDALVLSHAAADHTGGAPAVASRLRPGLLVDGRSGNPDPPTAAAAATVRAAGGRVVPGRAGLVVAAGDLRAEIRWPPAGQGPTPAGEDPNDRALVVRAVVGGLRVLVPSDREGIPLRRAAGGPVDLLVLPHHGSADDDVPRLLEDLRPRAAIAQVGAHNGYGHPAPPTVAAVRAARVPLWRTDRNGSVGVRGGPGGPRVEATRGAGGP
ncbi:ComEC/Rec2 family competence protein [Patulibacter minatonensis]|uniref:ComEC/Rec2 family competence protein n=1 Tax=Patulibacter minatonensis TaxID=298163 RepID=UPI00047AB419|nr:ComEC/Rec2 family competence protein [Patulibacter minatonensis]